jgi:hypothetical protein
MWDPNRKSVLDRLVPRRDHVKNLNAATRKLLRVVDRSLDR